MKLSVLIAILASLRECVAHEWHPIDTSSLAKLSFFDQFNYDSLESSGWIPSIADKSTGAPYAGQWSLEEAKKYPGYAGDKALTMTSEAALYAISKKLPNVISNENKDLVLQYELKFSELIACGGGYLKLLSVGLEPETFNDETAFEIMFGPDICGSSNKIYFIMKKKVGSEIIESLLRTPPMARNHELSTLYTLIVRQNLDVEIRINGEVAKAGNILNTPNFMVPPLAVPEFIPDASAEKPDDWDDRRFVFDLKTKKPADWDEKHGRQWIPNPDIETPRGWNDDVSEVEFIRDPDARKPASWVDEEDGEWKPPIIRNPKCLYGCGKWEAPKIVNPEYQGEWAPPAIENPDYQGEWTPPLVENPDFDEDAKFHITPVGAIGIEVWSMHQGVSFNNIYLGNSVDEAERLGNATFIPKLELENADYAANKPKAKHEPRPPPKTFEDILDEDISHFLRFFELVKAVVSNQILALKDHWFEFQRDPVPFITTHPIKFAFSCVAFLFVFTIVFGLINVVFFLYVSSPQEPTQKELEKEQPVMDELTEDEIIAQITGKSTGAKVGATKATRRGEKQ